MDLFPAVQLSRETFSSRGLSVVPVRGDAMFPTLRGEWDYVLAAPVKKFLYDACYVIEVDGMALIYRFQSFGRGKIRLLRDNQNYPSDESDVVPREWFDEHVLGIVVCELKVKDPDLMRAAQAA